MVPIGVFFMFVSVLSGLAPSLEFVECIGILRTGTIKLMTVSVYRWGSTGAYMAT